jgi:hypothetical protein
VRESLTDTCGAQNIDFLMHTTMDLNALRLMSSFMVQVTCCRTSYFKTRLIS